MCFGAFDGGDALAEVTPAPPAPREVQPGLVTTLLPLSPQASVHAKPSMFNNIDV